MRTLTLLCLVTCGAYTYQVALPTYVAEVYFVIDREVVNNYITERTETRAAAREKAAIASIRADANYFLSEVNDILSSVTSQGLNIEVRSRRMEILNNNIYSGDTVDVAWGLPQFETWLRNRSAYKNLKYDLAMLWTGFELTGSGSTATSGFAAVGTVCRGAGASSIVEFKGTFHTAAVTAHELGHNLGASHDGSASGFIMAASSNVSSPDRWSFSLCSISDIITNIKKLGLDSSSNCLLNTNPVSIAPIQPITEQLEDPDVICNRALNSQESYMCKNVAFYGSRPKGDTVCKQIFCSVPGSANCRSSFPSDGMICGQGKRCNDGKCQRDLGIETTNVNPNCIWGDQKVVKVKLRSGDFVGSCRDLLKNEPSTICYSVGAICCETCKPFATGIEGCEYGDRWNGCVESVQDNICPFHSDYYCCGFCQGYTGKRDTNHINSTVVIPLEVIEGLKVEIMETKEPEKPAEISFES